jgi:hypothetical protein
MLLQGAGICSHLGAGSHARCLWECAKELVSYLMLYRYLFWRQSRKDVVVGIRYYIELVFEFAISTHHTFDAV